MLKTLIALLLIESLNAFGIKSISANFTQIINNEVQSIEYSGKLIATLDSKAYWEYNKPTQKKIIINNNKIIIYEPEIKQAIVSSQSSIDFLQVINSMKKSKDGLYESIIDNTKFYIFTKDNKPYKMEYIDNLDNEIIILLSNVKTNIKIDENVFDLKLPEDVNIISN